MEQDVSKALKINLIGLPWPVNLLQCSRQIDTMQPGDKLTIALADKAIKNNLIKFFHALPDLSFDVSHAEFGYIINVKKRSGNSGEAAT
jgi:TusA-related sulfurtransferase